MNNDKEIFTSIRRAAMNALARREHTRYELEQKLIPRFPEHKSLVAHVLEQLSDDGLQSDQRFVESFIRWRSNRGYGPVRIAIEMGQKGIDDVYADEMLANADIDWLLLLQQQYRKKFGETVPQSLAEKAKVQRFLQYKGFSHTDINCLFKTLT